MGGGDEAAGGGSSDGGGVSGAAGGMDGIPVFGTEGGGGVPPEMPLSPKP